MEDGDVAALLQLPLNFKTAGSGDILQIHAAKRSSQQCHGVDDVIHIVAPDTQGNSVYITKGLEENALTFHNRHAGLRTNITQPQNSGAVCDHGDRVPASGQLVAFVGILLNF